MPTNEERRTIAANLRSIADGKHSVSKNRLMQIVGLENDSVHGVMFYESESVKRLADLIEPAKSGFNTFSSLCPKCGGSTYLFCDDYDWWTIICDSCGATHGFDPDNYIPYGEIENEWKESVNVD